jgi:hypothetical protein
MMSCPSPCSERAEARGGEAAAVAWESKIVYLPNYIFTRRSRFPGEMVDYMPFQGAIFNPERQIMFQSMKDKNGNFGCNGASPGFALWAFG